MRFKMIIALVNDPHTEEVMDAARKAGATGITVIPRALGEGGRPKKTFLGLTLETQRDVLLLVVEEHLSRHILETICEVGRFETKSGAGIAMQMDLEDVVGIAHQARALEDLVEDEL